MRPASAVEVPVGDRRDLGLLQPTALRLGADAQLAGHAGDDPEPLPALLGDQLTGPCELPVP